MLASELALELGMDPSVVSKRLNIYFGEVGRDRERHLSPQTVANVRQAHDLLTSGRAKAFKQAVQMVLGTFAEPVPPESVRLLGERLEQLEARQQETLRQVNRILRHIESALAPPPLIHPHGSAEDV